MNSITPADAAFVQRVNGDQDLEHVLRASTYLRQALWENLAGHGGVASEDLDVVNALLVQQRAERLELRASGEADVGWTLADARDRAHQKLDALDAKTSANPLKRMKKRRNFEAELVEAERELEAWIRYVPASAEEAATEAELGHAQVAQVAASHPAPPTATTGPAPATTPGQATQRAAPASVQDASEPVALPPPPPLTACDISILFDGVKWDARHWRKNMSDGSKWLLPARVLPGVRGGASALWSPLELAKLLMERGDATVELLRGAFKRVGRFLPSVAAWAPAWMDYEAKRNWGTDADE